MICTCAYCNIENLDCRPYGENDKMICFSCAFKNQDTAKIVKSNFLEKLNSPGLKVIDPNLGVVTISQDQAEAMIEKITSSPIVH